MRLVGLFAGGLVVLGILLWGVLLVSIRTGFGPVLDFIRRMNRRVTNPKVMKKAGMPGSGAAVVQHEGRVTGALYATPVAVAETDSGFAIALPYGTRPDWLKNVMASGRARLIHQGATFESRAPLVVSDGSADRFFSSRELRVNRLYGIDQVLVLMDAVRVEEARA